MKNLLTKLSLIDWLLLSIVLIIALLPIYAKADTAEISWTAPTKNCDGTNLTNLARYKIYWGTVGRVAAGIPSNLTGGCGTAGLQPTNSLIPTAYNRPVILVASPTQLAYVVDLPSPNTRYYFAMTAINSVNEESNLTGELSKVSAAAPIIVFGTPTCATCASYNGLILSGLTGAVFTIVWQPVTVNTSLQMFEYPPKTGAIPVLTANFNPGVQSYNWVPTRAGVYYTRMCTTTCVDSYNSSFLFHIKLAPPTGGGID